MVDERKVSTELELRTKVTGVPTSVQEFSKLKTAMSDQAFRRAASQIAESMGTVQSRLAASSKDTKEFARNLQALRAQSQALGALTRAFKQLGTESQTSSRNVQSLVRQTQALRGLRGAAGAAVGRFIGGGPGALLGRAIGGQFGGGGAIGAGAVGAAVGPPALMGMRGAVAGARGGRGLLGGPVAAAAGAGAIGRAGLGGGPVGPAVAGALGVRGLAMLGVAGVALGAIAGTLKIAIGQFTEGMEESRRWVQFQRRIAVAQAFGPQAEIIGPGGGPEVITGPYGAVRRGPGLRAAQGRGVRRKISAQAASSVQQGVGRIVREGTALGLSADQSLQIALSALQAGGGEITDPGAVESAMTALHAMRLQLAVPEVTGMFRMGVRRRAFANLPTGPITPGAEIEPTGVAIMRAEQQARRIGLRGPGEIAGYIRSIAGLIQQWQNTGIPIDDKRLGREQMRLSKLFGPVQGARMGFGIQQFGRQLGQRGPSGIVDLLSLQALSGVQIFGREGLNFQALEEAQIRAAEGRPRAGGGQERLLKDALGWIGGRAGAQASPEIAAFQRLTAQKLLSGVGVAAGGEVFAGGLRRLQGVELTDRQKQLEAQRMSAQGGAELLQPLGARARAITPRALERDIAIQNDRMLKAGKRMADAAFNLAEASESFLGATTNFEKTFTKATKGLKTIAETIESLSDDFRQLEVWPGE